MSIAGSIAAELRYVACGVISALLPQPQNRKLGQACGVDVAPYSLLLGVIEGVGGGLGFLFGAIAFMTGSVPVFNMILLEGWFPDLTTTHFMGGGLVSLLVWCTHPLSWVLAMFGLTGLVRIVAYSTSREPVGEPLVWVVLRVSTLVKRSAGSFFEARSLGPRRPDRFIWGKDHDLTILTCRPRDDWTESIALEVEGRYFRLTGVEQRVEGAHRVMAYSFAELAEHDVIRNPKPYVSSLDQSR